MGKMVPKGLITYTWVDMGITCIFKMIFYALSYLPGGEPHADMREQGQRLPESRLPHSPLSMCHIQQCKN